MNLGHRLHQVIEHIEKSAKTAQMISINAGVIAVRTRAETNEAFAFEAVAEQIKTISEESISKIGTLRNVLTELKELSATINAAGRQRMLSQKIMKQYLISRYSETIAHTSLETTQLISQFETTLRNLERSPLNNSRIDSLLSDVSNFWMQFRRALESNDLESAIDYNNHVLESMNAAVNGYEQLSGN